MSAIAQRCCCYDISTSVYERSWLATSDGETNPTPGHGKLGLTVTLVRLNYSLDPTVLLGCSWVLHTYALTQVNARFGLAGGEYVCVISSESGTR